MYKINNENVFSCTKSIMESRLCVFLIQQNHDYVISKNKGGEGRRRRGGGISIEG